MNPGILYISYDGMLEPLGQSQVLAYLERLGRGHRIHLISFEKPASRANGRQWESVKERIAAAGIHWHPLRYHKKPTATATAYDIAAGTALAIALTVRYRLRLIHARSYVAGLIGLGVKRATRIRFLFDMRGFWADERVDGGLWRSNGRFYRAAKRAERSLLLGADHIVTLTHASETEIRRFEYLRGGAAPVSVIPTCADLDRFRIQGPLQCDPFVLGYIGSVGTWYLLDEMLQSFVILRGIQPNSRLLIANQAEHDWINERVGAHGIAEGEFELVAAPPAEMPAVIARMTAGMALIKPAYSKIASAPTKLAEYLGCGLPCLGSTGCGDMAEILEERRVGIALPGNSAGELLTGVERLVALTREADVQQRCRDVAVDLFSVDKGASAYAAIYDRLTGAVS